MLYRLSLTLFFLLFSFSYQAFAGGLSYVDTYYDSFQHAADACAARRNGTCQYVPGEYHYTGEGTYDPNPSTTTANCLDSPSWTVTCYRYHYGICPEGTQPDPVTGECISVPDPCEATALQGDVWNSQTESCECPTGTTAAVDPVSGYSCLDDAPPCTSDSPNYKGTANGYPVCDWDGFCDAGQSGGFVNGHWVCVNDATCGLGETYINGVCVGPDDANNDDTPNSDPTPDDTDNDGIPDDTDTDDDNDGTPDTDDPTPTGEGPVKSGRASSNCSVPPSCDGDPIQCSMLHQQWIAMCGNFITAAFPDDCSNIPTCSGPPWECAILKGLQTIHCAGYTPGSAVLGALSTSTETVTNVLSGLDSTPDLIGTGSCPVLPTFSVGGTQVSYSLVPVCTFLTTINPVVVFLGYILGVYIVFNAMTGSRRS